MTVLFDTGSGKHRRLINMTEVGEANTPEYRATSLLCMRFVGATLQVPLKEEDIFFQLRPWKNCQDLQDHWLV